MSATVRVMPVSPEDAAIRKAFQVAEVAFLTGATYEALFGLIHAGELPHLKIGARYIVPARAVDALIDSARAVSA